MFCQAWALGRPRAPARAPGCSHMALGLAQALACRHLVRGLPSHGRRPAHLAATPGRAGVQPASLDVQTREAGSAVPRAQGLQPASLGCADPRGKVHLTLELPSQGVGTGLSAWPRPQEADTQRGLPSLGRQGQSHALGCSLRVSGSTAPRAWGLQTSEPKVYKPPSAWPADPRDGCRLSRSGLFSQPLGLKTTRLDWQTLQRRKIKNNNNNYHYYYCS